MPCELSISETDIIPNNNFCIARTPLAPLKPKTPRKLKALQAPASPKPVARRATGNQEPLTVAEPPPRTNLYLKVPAAPSGRAESNLVRAVARFNVACLMLCNSADTAIDTDWANRLRTLAHAHSLPLLLQDDAAQAQALQLDGVHLTAHPALYRRARESLGADAIIGVTCLTNRHDAMMLAELGADYVAFPARMQSMTGTDDFPSDFISWWSEIFEVPCIAWDVCTEEEARTATRSGADFIALAEKCLEAVDFDTHLARIAAAIAESEPAQ